MKTVRIAQPVFMILAGLAIALFLRSQLPALREYSWRILPGLLLLSIISLLLTWALEVEIWRRILARFGGKLAYGPAARIWFLSAILRYIPGNIWQPLGMTFRCIQHGIRPEITITSIAFYQLIILLAAAPFIALYVWVGAAGGYIVDLVRSATPLLAALVIAPIVAFVLHPGWLIGVLNILLVRIGRHPMEADLDSRALVGLLLIAIVNWAMWGATFAAFTLSIAEVHTGNLGQTVLLLIASYPIAYSIGFLSLLTPSGFGVREGAFFVLLSPVMPGGVVTVTALAMRILTALGELVIAGVSLPFENASMVRIRSTSGYHAMKSGSAPDCDSGRSLTSDIVNRT